MEKSKLVDFTAYICLIRSKLRLPQNQHYPNRFLSLSPKLFLWTSKQPFIKQFFLASCNVCPMVIPNIFAQTQGADYWKLIHIKSALQHITKVNTKEMKDTYQKYNHLVTKPENFT